MRNFIIAALAFVLCACGPKGYQSYTWEYHEIDSRYDSGPDTAAIAAIAKYDSSMAALQEVVCYSKDVYAKEKPESGLSNLMADALREFAGQRTGEKIDLGLTNFGGIRTELPKGAVRIYDIYSISPFNNYVTVLDVKGLALRKMFNRMAETGGFQALSGIKMTVADKKLKECLVGGKPLDDNRLYKVATIDFLVTGGDGMDFGDGIVASIDTGVTLREALIDILRQKMAAGEVLDLRKDGRITVTYSNDK
ncbi:MAG: 5'-nucleotidase C-terminal domain-containing protein [Bacteroidales bacterium]|nr:5'-nucleotidase C-terminal domain-containing protein [Bacteroidales bacterium]